jgi:membrane associated rhomboid family serine protease
MTARGGASCDVEGERAAPAVAKWLHLAATPTFVVMALITIAGGGGEFVCSTAHGAHLDGMAAMYLLMSAFHAAPWMKLFGGWRGCP